MDKAGRVLILFNALIRGRKINKADFANNYGVNERTFDRDIEAVRNILAEIHSSAEVLFDKLENHYYMKNWSEHESRGLSAIEAIIVLKTLLSSRALRKDEMQGVFHSVYPLVVPDERKMVINAVNNDIEKYISPVHGKAVMKMLEDLSNVIQRRFKIELQYSEEGDCLKKYVVAPMAIIFFEYYFYLLAVPDGNDHVQPAVFRVDKIECFKLLDERYAMSLYEQWRQRNILSPSQAINSEKVVNVKLRCHKSVLEGLYSTFPRSQLVKDDGDWAVCSTVASDEAILRWVLSQGNYVELLAPDRLRQQFIQQLCAIQKIYQNKKI